MQQKDNTVPYVNDSELEELETELRGKLSKYVTRTPAMEDTQRLILNLQSEFMQLGGQDKTLAELRSLPLRKASLIGQCVQQARIYGKPFWLISALAVGMMTLLSSGSARPAYGFTDAFSLVLPIFLLAAVVYTFRTWNPEMRMVESVTPFPPALLLLSRLLVVTGMIVTFGLAGTIFLKLTGLTFPAGAFLLNWLSGVLFISGILASLTFRRGIRTGLIASVVIWAVMQGMGQLLGRKLLAFPWLMGTIQLTLLAIGLVLLFVSYRASLRGAWGWDAGAPRGRRQAG